MLINTVILFIRDLLPIFVLLCFIFSCLDINHLSKMNWLMVFFINVLGVFAVFYFYPSLAELFDGFGVEISKTFALILVYVCLVFSCSLLVIQQSITSLQHRIMLLGVVIFIIINTSEFLVFLNSYISNTQSISDILAGLSMGLGICLSFSALLYFLLNWLKRKSMSLILYSLLALFLSGQISQVVNLLQQIDIVTSSEAIWDSSNIVKDSSEYGHLFKTLFGYEASPSLEFLMVYAASLIIFSITYFIKASINIKSKSVAWEVK